MKATKKFDLYETVTNQILDRLEQGEVPWLYLYDRANAPMNLRTKKAYRGMNIFLLMAYAAEKKYERNLWLSYKQCEAMGGQVRKGEKGHIVIFWKMLPAKDEETSEDTVIPLLRYYKVFNVAQCDGLEDKLPKVDVQSSFKPVKLAEDLVKSIANQSKIFHGVEFNPCYIPSQDAIRMPNKNRYHKREAYYGSLFHELTHSTGHKDRLNRKGIYDGHFGNSEYSKEELIAEMGAAFLKAMTGIPQLEERHSAEYIRSWLKALSNDKRMVVTAAGKAQRATEYLIKDWADNPYKNAEVENEETEEVAA